MCSGSGRRVGRELTTGEGRGCEAACTDCMSMAKRFSGRQPEKGRDIERCSEI